MPPQKKSVHSEPHRSERSFQTPRRSRGRVPARRRSESARRRLRVRAPVAASGPPGRRRLSESLGLAAGAAARQLEGFRIVRPGPGPGPGLAVQRTRKKRQVTEMRTRTRTSGSPAGGRSLARPAARHRDDKRRHGPLVTVIGRTRSSSRCGSLTAGSEWGNPECRGRGGHWQGPAFKVYPSRTRIRGRVAGHERPPGQAASSRRGRRLPVAGSWRRASAVGLGPGSMADSDAFSAYSDSRFFQ